MSNPGPTYEFGDMWETWGRANTLFLVTANSTIRKDGALIMGRGIALQLKNKESKYAHILGEHVSRFKQAGYPDYGLLVLTDTYLKAALGHWRSSSDFWVGAFQVKRNFYNNAELELIQASVDKLKEFCQDHPHRQVNLNFPGIGYGRLTECMVKPLLKGLPAQVHIWRFRHQQRRV